MPLDYPPRLNGVLPSAPGCWILHRIAFPVVSEWYQQRPRVHLPLSAHFAKAAARRGYAQLHPGPALWPRVEV